MPYWGVMSDRWVAVDVETAADRDSICAVGIVEWVDGELRKIGRWLLRPPRGEVARVPCHSIHCSSDRSSPRFLHECIPVHACSLKYRCQGIPFCLLQGHGQ